MKQKIWDIFAVQDDDLLSAIMPAATNETALSEYYELVSGDLSTDELQKIFQYYYADRKEKSRTIHQPPSQNFALLRPKQTGTPYMTCALAAER